MSSFQDLSISEAILQSIDEMGFKTPSPIQEKSIPVSLQGKDIIGQAQTGTGKTAAFGIPILEKIKPSQKIPQALIICPTRELAIQVNDEIKRLAKYIKGVKTTPIYGGEDIEKQFKRIKEGAQIVVGTPGRITDHLNRKTLNFDEIETVVLDEADEMLDMGFIEDIRNILQYTPESKQTLLFSATIPKEIEKIARDYQNNPEIVRVISKELTSSDVTQKFYEVKRPAKIEALSRLVEYYNINLGLVFCNTKKLVDDLNDRFNEKGIKTVGLHGDMSQNQRNRTLEKFKKRNVTLLIATDVAARGIDVNNVDAVFNYDVPEDIEFYIHRIGRTGRAGKKGIAFTFISDKSEFYRLKDIQRYAKSEIEQNTIPSLEEINQIKLENLKADLKKEFENDHLQEFYDLINEFEKEGYDIKELASVMLRILYQRKKARFKNEKIDSFQPDYNNKRKDKNKDKDKNGKRKHEKETSNNSNMTRLFLNLGKDQSLTPGDIINAFSSHGNIQGKEIGKIDIKNRFSFVEVPKSLSQDLISELKNQKLKGHSMNVEISK